MSQFSTHVRAPVKAEKQGAATRGRAMTKASGDATNPCKPANNRSKSKINKLPKNLRYDLETALVGLCDVWFEEIKPHLVQNNIKLHVNTKAAGSDHQMVESAAGCSHLDPGAASDALRRASASCAACCSVPRPTSRPRCRKRLTRPRPPRAQLLHPQMESDSRVAGRRSRRRARTPRPEDWRPPRVSRTYSVIARDAALVRTDVDGDKKRVRRRLLKYKRRVLVEKAIQTDVSQCCIDHNGWGVKSMTVRANEKLTFPQPANEKPKLRSRANQSLTYQCSHGNQRLSSPQKSPKLLPLNSQLKKEEVLVESPYSQTLFVTSPTMMRNEEDAKVSCHKIYNRAKQTHPERNTPIAGVVTKKSMKMCGRKRGTENALQLLYQNPTGDDPNSLMNLVMSVTKGQFKRRPWR